MTIITILHIAVVVSLIVLVLAVAFYCLIIQRGKFAEFYFEDSIRKVTIVFLETEERVYPLLYVTESIGEKSFTSIWPKTPHAFAARKVLCKNGEAITSKDKVACGKKTARLLELLGLYKIETREYTRTFKYIVQDRKPYIDYANNKLDYKTGEKVSFDQDSAYAVLGLKPTASPNEIHTRYRDLVKVFHPDRSPDTDDEAMKRINTAYASLKEMT